MPSSGYAWRVSTRELAPRPDRLRDHWASRPEWGPERTCLYWYLTFRDDEIADAVGHDVLEVVAGAPWLDAVPPPWFHVTVADVGFTDVLEPPDADAVLAAVAEELAGQRAFRLALGPVRTFATAVVLRARPRDRLDEVKDRIRRATARTIGARHADFHHHPYRPHLTLGYANTEVPEGDLSAFRERLPAVDGHVQVDALRLVAVTRRDHGYRWDEVARVGLG